MLATETVNLPVPLLKLVMGIISTCCRTLKWSKEGNFRFCEKQIVSVSCTSAAASASDMEGTSRAAGTQEDASVSLTLALAKPLKKFS